MYEWFREEPDEQDFDLSYKDQDCEKVHQEMPPGDVEPGNCLPVHDESSPGIVFADKTDMEVYQEFHGVQNPCIMSSS